MSVEQDLGLGVEVRLAREMSLFSVTMIGVGAMIGAGIFVLTGIAAGVAGPALVLAFLLNGLVTLFTAMAYAELGSCFHDAGGGYLWIKEGLPQPNGFLAGWMSWFAHAVACSLYALGFGAYFGHVLSEGFGIEMHGLPLSLDKSLAVLACLLFAYVNFRGASETGKMGNIVTLAKIFVIALFIAFGLGVIAHKAGWTVEFKPFLPTGMSGVFMAMGLTFIAFQGYEVIAQCSEEVVAPKRNIPRAVFFALAIVIPIYLLVSFVALGAISGDGMPTWKYLGEKREIAMVEAARQFLPGGAVIFLVGGLLSTLSALNATIYSSSRVAFAMARDANLPDFFARVHPRRKTPHLSILASAVLVILMALLLPIEDVASAADIMFLLVFMQVNVVAIRLRRSRPDLDRGYRIPLFPLIPVVGIATQVFIAIFLIRYSPKAFITALVWIGTGMAVHYLYATKKEARVVEFRAAIGRLARKEYRILVALAEKEAVQPLMRVATALAQHFDGEIVALTVVEVPYQTPLATARQLPGVAERRTVLRLAEHVADEAGVPCRRFVRISHRLSRAILETAIEEECNFIILGQSARPRFVSRVVKTSVDQVLAHAPCHVAIVKGRLATAPASLVLAVDDDRNSRLAQQLLPAFVESWRTPAKVLAFASGGTPARAQEVLDTVLKETPLPPGAETKIVTGDVPSGILSETAANAAILMGDAPYSGLARLVTPSVADRVVAKADQMMILVKAYRPAPKRSLLVRLLTGA